MIVELYDSPQLSIPKGELWLTINIETLDCCYLAEMKYGRRWFSSDQKAYSGEATKEKISAIYAAVGISEPEVFTSLAARTNQHGARHCNAYGPIILSINQDRVRNGLIIFNGDVKDIGGKLQGEEISKHRDWIETHTLGEPTKDIISAMDRLVNARRSGEMPRLIGSYFEARLDRALLLTDIGAIYVPRNFPKALQCAESILEAANETIAK